MAVETQVFDVSGCPCCGGVWCNSCRTKGKRWYIVVTNSLYAPWNREWTIENDCTAPGDCSHSDDTECISFKNFCSDDEAGTPVCYPPRTYSYSITLGVEHGDIIVVPKCWISRWSSSFSSLFS